MKLTIEKIKLLSSKDYIKYRKQIKEFYKLNRDYSYKIERIYWDIHSRCTNSKCCNYKYYGGRGIKNYLTKDNIKELWFRDKAYNMIKPSIDRKDNDGNYEISNCQFIELSENVRKRFN